MQSCQYCGEVASTWDSSAHLYFLNNTYNYGPYVFALASQYRSPTRIEKNNMVTIEMNFTWAKLLQAVFIVPVDSFYTPRSD